MSVLSQIGEFIKDPFGFIFDAAYNYCKDTGIEIIDTLAKLVVTPMSFDWVAGLTTAFQFIAVAVVLIIVMVKGVTSGILLNGGSEDESVGHYLFKSFVPIALIAATPVITSTIITITTGLVARVFTSCSTTDFATKVVDNAFGTGGVSGFGIIFFFIYLYYIVTICFQCIKRWIQLEALSVLVPITCIFTATEDSSDYVTILKSMALTGVTTSLQILFLFSVPAIPAVGMALGSGTGSQMIYGWLLTAAAFAAIKQVPQWIEKYTYGSSVSGRGNGVSNAIILGTRGGSAVARIARR